MIERTGVHLSEQLPIEDVVEIVKLSEDLGYERFFISDVFVRDPFVVLTACAGATEQIGLGTAVMPLYGRHPLNAAVASASLANLSDQRFCFGVGTSHQEMVEARLGIPWRRPLTHLLEYVGVVRALHTGQHVDHNGEFYQISAQLSVVPDEVVPIYFGPSGHALFERAGAVADGVVLNWGSAEFLAERLQLLANGRSGAGRATDSVEVACSLWCVVTDSAEETEQMRDSFRLRAAFFAQMSIYRQRFRELGYVEEMDAVEAAHRAGAPVEAAISDGLIDTVSVIGDPEYCRHRLDQYRAAGIGLPLVVPLTTPNGDLRLIRRTLRALAP